MSMSKQDFIALADAIREFNKDQTRFPKDVQRPFTYSQITQLAHFCHRQNAAFKPDRWLSYIDGECGPNGGEVKKPRGLAESYE